MESDENENIESESNRADDSNIHSNPSEGSPSSSDQSYLEVMESDSEVSALFSFNGSSEESDVEFVSANNEITTHETETNGANEDTDQNFGDDLNIDLNLPGMHSYLNKEMEQLVGRIILEPETLVDLFLFWWPNVILVPGQKLPLQVPSGRAEIFIRAKETNRIIGFIASPIDRSSLNGCVGTTAEMISIRSEDSGVTAIVIGRQRFMTISVRRRNDNNLQGKVRILAEYSELSGSNRYPLQNALPMSWRIYGPSSKIYPSNCNILDYTSCASKKRNETIDFVQSPTSSTQSTIRTNRNNSGSFFSRIVSAARGRSSGTASSSTASQPPNQNDLNDSQQQTPLVLLPGDPMAMISSSQSTWLTPENLQELTHIITPAVDNKGRQFVYSRSMPISASQLGIPSRIPARRDVYAAAAHCFGVFPSWVYELYDTERLIGLVVRELKEWNNTWKLDHWTEEIAVQFSYWLVQNLPVPNEHKIDLLQRDHVVSRLRGCLDLLVKCSNFLCVSCQQLITTKQKIVCLATEGSLQTFVNPHGHLHEMVTVSSVSNVHMIGRATQEYSWFPGYAWTIMQCRNCYSHLGWKFSACKTSLKPSLFFGVCRSSVIPSFDTDNAHNQLNAIDIVMDDIV